MSEYAERKFAKIKKLCCVQLFPKSDKITVHIAEANYRITAYTGLSKEYKFPTWSANKKAIADWFWEWVEMDQFKSAYLAAVNEQESYKLFQENKHTLAEIPLPEPEPEIEWECRKCGSTERPSIAASMCKACRAASHNAAQKQRNETRALRRTQGVVKKRRKIDWHKNLEANVSGPWKCECCGSLKRPSGRGTRRCKVCREKEAMIS